MKLNVRLLGNRSAKLIGDKKAIKLVADHLKCDDPSARFTYAFKQGHWDGKIHLVSGEGIFPIGLTNLVLEFCELSGISVMVTDKRSAIYIPKKISKTVGSMKLRDYQYDTVKALFSQKIGGVPFPRGIVSAATNAGKSLIAASIVKSICDKTSCLILTPRVEIFNQFVKWFRDYFDEEIGQFNTKRCELENITIAMITTMYARRKSSVVKGMLDYYGCIIVDEAHHSSSDSWSKVIGRSKAAIKVGLSGTALKMEHYRNMRTLGLFGPVVASITNKDLVDSGYSAKPHITILNYNQPDLMDDERIGIWTYEINELNRKSKALTKSGGYTYAIDKRLRELRRKVYTLAYNLGISECETRAMCVHDVISIHSEGQILIIVNKIDHGKFLRKYLLGCGVGCVFVSGQDSDTTRISVLNDFTKGKIKVLIATMIYKEGIDVPSIDVLILAMGGKAPITVLQTFGRGLRTRKGKKSVPVYDFNDLSHKILAEHSAQRISIYKAEKFNPIFK
jgi:superfamily II DNA or RNA helicase